MKRHIASTALSLILALPAAAQDSIDAGTVLATVGETEITLGHVIAMLTVLPPEYQGLPDNVLFDGLLEQLVQQEVLAAVAEQDIGLTERLGLENERRAFLAATLIERVGNTPIAAADLQAAYDAQFGSVGPITEYNASHILLDTEDDAQAVIAALAEGADFAELARERSTGPSGPNGGALGWFTAGMMVPTFEQAVFSLSVGEVSAPVETQFGWHVILLNETRDQAPPAIEDVRAELEDGLRRARVEATMQELTAAAEITRSAIEIDPAVIRDLDLLAE
ncbi:peptidylprolyl isomerase [Rhodobacterales bacterium LSUCC0031]|nr:peptidylprolyl isomerase [Rhodobacterales bacterium LSUCC0031]